MPTRRDRKGKKACGFACETGYIKIRLAASNHSYIRGREMISGRYLGKVACPRRVRWRQASSKVVDWKPVSLGAQSLDAQLKGPSSSSVTFVRSYPTTVQKFSSEASLHPKKGQEQMFRTNVVVGML